MNDNVKSVSAPSDDPPSFGRSKSTFDVSMNTIYAHKQKIENFQKLFETSKTNKVFKGSLKFNISDNITQ